MPLALSIAGSDPTGGAGLQLDLQVFRALGVHGAGVVTAITVQDTARVHQVLPAFPSVVRDQLRVLLRDVRPDAVKVGMLATDDVLRAVDLGLDALGPAEAAPPLVLDPVLAASAGGPPLLERRAWGSLALLSRRATLVTPNLPEAEALTGRDVSSREGVETAARAAVEELGARAALVKGGHAAGPPHDCLAVRGASGTVVRWLEGERIEGPPVHGTGCALASAVAAHLALGHELVDAVERARAFLRRALGRAFAAGAGARLLGLG
jgi:hydroxymethylpyrimidine/phosphomethylpyrimidine kinase